MAEWGPDMRIEIPPRTTLVRLVLRHPRFFYKQDWYFDEEFANTDVGGVWEIPVDPRNQPLLPAAVWAWFYIARSKWLLLEDRYIWTSDSDNARDKVYVGRGRGRGLQIHRHLIIRQEMFANEILD